MTLAVPRTCPNCGAEVKPEMVYCSKCGRKLGAKVCPSCGYENPPYAEKFCIKCGSQLKIEVKPLEKPIPQVAQPPEIVTPQLPVKRRMKRPYGIGSLVILTLVALWNIGTTPQDLEEARELADVVNMGLLPPGTEAYARFLLSSYYVYIAAWLAIGLLQLILVIGLWKAKRWSRKLAIAVLSLALVVSLAWVAAILPLGLEHIPSAVVLSVVWNAIVFFGTIRFVNRPDVKRYLESEGYETMAEKPVPTPLAPRITPEEMGKRPTELRVQLIRRDLEDITTILRGISSKLLPEEMREISGKVGGMLMSLEEISREPGSRSKQADSLFSRLLDYTAKVRRDAERLRRATDGEEEKNARILLLDDASLLEDRFRSVRLEIAGLFFRPRRISVLGILLYIGGILGVITGLIPGPSMGIGIIFGVIDIISGYGLRKMKKWGAILASLILVVGMIYGLFQYSLLPQYAFPPEFAQLTQIIMGVTILFLVLFVAIIASAWRYYK